MKTSNYPPDMRGPVEDKKFFTLTSTAGKFVFDKSVLLNHAKLIRDAITASFKGSLPRTPMVDPAQPDRAPHWIHEHLAGPVGKAFYPFEWDPTGCWSN